MRRGFTRSTVSITLGARHGHATPHRTGCNHTGGGNIDIQQPTSDTVIITMTGVAVAAGHPFKASSASMHFDLDQRFEVSFDDPKVKNATLSIEGRVIGLLRGGSKSGTAGFSVGRLWSQAPEVDGVVFLKGAAQRAYLRGTGGLVATEGERPDAGIDEQRHRRERSAL